MLVPSVFTSPHPTSDLTAYLLGLCRHPDSPLKTTPNLSYATPHLGRSLPNSRPLRRVGISPSCSPARHRPRAQISLASSRTSCRDESTLFTHQDNLHTLSLLRVVPPFSRILHIQLPTTYYTSSPAAPSYIQQGYPSLQILADGHDNYPWRRIKRLRDCIMLCG
jgi:hypothetical protein